MKYDTQISIRLSSELLDRARQVAKDEDRTVNSVLRRAIEAGLDATCA